MGTTCIVSGVFFLLGGTLPETNIAPKNGWLEYYTFLLGRPIFRGYVSFRECTEKKRKKGRGLGNDIGRPVVHPQPTKILEPLDRLDSRRKKHTPCLFGSCLFIWLVVEPTHLKNMSQIGNLPQIGVKIPKIFELPPPSHGF